jgi:phosphoribosylaminoimidazolecarboxamide formyltransferase/IMP cyclohydrolase
MRGNIPIRRALISVSDKSGIVSFAQSLASHNIEIVSTGGTAKRLQEAGLQVLDISSITGFPEMLDGRVKTLHPAVHGALLGVRDEPSHISAMEEHSIEPIDLICIDLYPFEKTITKSNVSDEEVIEQIDIGGPAMIRSAAKNHNYVTVITNPKQYELVLADLETHQGETTYELRSDLAREAFARTASYDATINQWMEGSTLGFPPQLHLTGTLEQTLRYGENPDQAAAVYKDPQFQGPSVVTASVVAGKPLSYNNLMDAAAALELVQDLQVAMNLPSAAIIKHANPCGAAVHESISEAFSNAWKCDPLAAFGGIVSLSGRVDASLARTIAHGEKFLEVIVATSFTEEGIDILSSRWKNIRLLAIGDEPRQQAWQQLRSVEGGILIQELQPVQADPNNWEHVAGPNPSTTQLQDATLAWIACGHLKSNSISIVDQCSLIGGGMGQVDRVSAAKVAIERAGELLTTATSPVAGSDAFFPFSDGPELLIDAGVTCIVQPGGSVRDQETIELCNSRDVSLLHTGTRRFRH